jgi:TfoX/Sxy family transcriptional regulator of competence genes
MAVDEALALPVRVALGDTGPVREVPMFGGVGFMLNGNMIAVTSKRGLLLRVGKEREADALAQPGARRVEMKGRPMHGYVFIDPPLPSDAALRDWLDLAVVFVRTLPPKAPKAKSGRKRV